MKRKLHVLDLFSGIGGFSLGLERTGCFETVAFCEIDPFCQKVLSKHWPKVEVFNDVTRFKYRKNVDLVTAGFPCQDISYAGEGAGITGERSGLFWYIIRTLCMVGRPRVLLENVAGLLTRGLGSVLGALATFGYDSEWHCIPAGAVGLPHPRDRIWIVAHSECEGRERPIAHDGIFSRSQKAYPIPSDRTLVEQFTLDVGSECIRKGDGLPVQSYRSRIKSLGNSVVPQIPEIFGLALLEMDSSDV